MIITILAILSLILLFFIEQQSQKKEVYTFISFFYFLSDCFIILKVYIKKNFEIFTIIIIVFILNYFVISSFFFFNTVNIDNEIFYIPYRVLIEDYNEKFFDYSLFYYDFFFKGGWIIFFFFFFNHYLNFFILLRCFKILSLFIFDDTSKEFNSFVLSIKNNLFIYLYFFILFVLLKCLFWFTNILFYFRELWCFSFLFFLFFLLFYNLFISGILIKRQKINLKKDYKEKEFFALILFIFLSFNLVIGFFYIFDLLPLSDKSFFSVNDRYFR